MTTGLKTVEWRQRYSSGHDDLLGDFYLPAIQLASEYDRAVAYFRSSILLLAQTEWADFVERGGRIRIACAPELTEEDAQAIAEGTLQRDAIEGAIRRDIEESLAELQNDGASLLANLVSIGCLDFRFMVRGTGIFHDKLGVFRDSNGNEISFIGSANETWSAWHTNGNHEAIEVFTSWGPDTGRVSGHTRQFEALWSGDEPGIESVPFSDDLKSTVLRFADPDPRESIAVRRRSTRTRAQPKALLPYQSDVVTNWRASGYRGIVRFATGSGKTITALAAVREWIADGSPALIIVPSKLLLTQWQSEIRAEIPEVKPEDVLLAGAGHTAWKSRPIMSAYTSKQDRGTGHITLAVLATAQSDQFISSISDPSSTLVVADEVHNLGSAKARSVFDVPAKGRLGLSATPERFRDPEGTALIRAYFGSDLEPVITIRDAIAAKRLCEYDYYIHRVPLDDEESEAYLDLSRRISQLLGRKAANDGSVDDASIENLQIRRGRIVKRAVGKATVAASIVASEYRDGDRWLIYCEDGDHLASTRRALSESGIASDEFYTSMPGDPAATLRRFEIHGGVLVAIRCLDEGVDIPAITHAVIAASSQNPRQFVQRRGRVLRTSRSTGKVRAVIHDLLVVPPIGDESESPAFDRMVASELRRAGLFAQDADNSAARQVIRQLIDEFGLDTDDLSAMSWDSASDDTEDDSVDPEETETNADDD